VGADRDGMVSVLVEVRQVPVRRPPGTRRGAVLRG
jgi:hypothetical protein